MIELKDRGDKAEIDQAHVLAVAMQAGHILLENGAEIARVEETMERIAEAYGVEYRNFFVLSNGIFTTGLTSDHENARWRTFAKVEHIPVKGTSLDRVVAVNQLSRDVASGKYTLDEASDRLEEIRQMPGKPAWLQILASGIGSACFAVIFGGTLWDAVPAFLAGLLLWVFMILAGSMSKILRNIMGGALVTGISILLFHLGLGDDLSHIIIGCIIPLVPGVPFTNGIRDIADGDYISGSVRLLDAMLVFLCIAIGVGLMFRIYVHCFGGVLL